MSTREQSPIEAPPVEDHRSNDGSKADEGEGGSKEVTRCPLCQEPFNDYSVLESHVMQLHSVNSEGLKRLLMLMEGSHWLNNARPQHLESAAAAEEPVETNNRSVEEQPADKGRNHK